MTTDYAQGQGGYGTTGGPEPLYFHTERGVTAGPLPMAALAGLASSGRLQRDDLVWAEGDATSTAAADVAALAPLFAQQPLSYQTPPKPLATYANFWQRFVAAVVDGLIMWVVNTAVNLACMGISAAAASGFPPAGRNRANMIASLTGSAIGLVTNWLYGALFESSAKQATPGKMAMGLIVVDEQGGRIGFGRATGRHFGKYISGLTLGIGYLMNLWTEKKQCLHDIMAGTLVLKK